MRRYAPFLLLGLILLIGCYWYMYDRSADKEYGDGPPTRPSDSTTDSPRTTRSTAPRPTPFPQTITLLPAAASADALNSAESTAEDDLSLIHSLLRSHNLWL